MARTILPRTRMPGTPRGYGDRSIEDEWLGAMRAALGVRDHPPAGRGARYEVSLEFRVWPDDPAYRGQMRPHGPDLDNTLKLTVDGLCEHDGRGVNLLHSDAAVYRITAEKRLVAEPDEAGAWISVEAASCIPD